MWVIRVKLFRVDWAVTSTTAFKSADCNLPFCQFGSFWNASCCAAFSTIAITAHILSNVRCWLIIEVVNRCRYHLVAMNYCFDNDNALNEICMHWWRSLLAVLAVAHPLCMPNGQVLLLALPLFCLQIDFSSISYWIDSYNHACILEPVQSSIFSQKCRQLLGSTGDTAPDHILALQLWWPFPAAFVCICRITIAF